MGFIIPNRSREQSTRYSPGAGRLSQRDLRRQMGSRRPIDWWWHLIGVEHSAGYQLVGGSNAHIADGVPGLDDDPFGPAMCTPLGDLASPRTGWHALSAD